MKAILYLGIISIVIGSVISCDGNVLTLFNLDYVNANGTKVHYGFKYQNMTMKYHVMDDTNLDKTVFKFIWNYSTDEEKQKGHEIIQTIGADFEELREDYGMVMVFFGKDLKKLKLYKRTEFGSAYSIEIIEKGVVMQFQFMIKAKEPNQDAFNDLINKIFATKPKQELNFLTEYIK
jgi:hypothetical protein